MLESQKWKINGFVSFLYMFIVQLCFGALLKFGKAQ